MLQQHLAAKRRKLVPTAIGLMPLSFFLRAQRFAPYNVSATSVITLPASIKFIKEIIELRRDSQVSVEQFPIRSFRCCGVRPSRPPAEPLGNDNTALRATSEDTCRQGKDGSGGSGSMWLAGAGGCLLRSAVNVSGEFGATVSLENKSRAALFILPSLILDSIKRVKELLYLGFDIDRFWMSWG